MTTCPNCGSDDISYDGRCNDCGFNQKKMRSLERIGKNISIAFLICCMAVFTMFLVLPLWVYGLFDRRK